MKKINNKKGFTLVELIVVIVIIGILASVLIPQITKYIDKARISNDTSDCKNMNTILNTYILENGIEPEDLDADEVRYIVSMDNKNYTFEPAYKNGVFYYSPQLGKILYTSDGISGSLSADTATPTAPKCVEEIREGYYYLNTSGKLANALATLRGLSNYKTYSSLMNDPVFEGVDITNILKYYDPAETLFINSNSGYTESSIIGSTSIINEPKKESDGIWYFYPTKLDTDGNMVADTANKVAIIDSICTLEDFIGTAPTSLPSNITSISIQNKKWVATYLDSGTYKYCYIVAKDDKYNPASASSSKVTKIVYQSRLSAVPALDLENDIIIDESVKIVLPVTVKTVLPEAFISIQSSNKIELKSSDLKVQFVEDCLSSTLAHANSISYVTLDDIKSNILANTMLLQFKTNNCTYTVKQDSNDHVYYLYNGEEKVSSSVAADADASYYTVNIPGEVKTMEIVTRDFFNANPSIDTINIDYKYTQDSIVNVTVRAFSDEGMLLNLVIAYTKQK